MLRTITIKINANVSFKSCADINFSFAANGFKISNIQTKVLLWLSSDIAGCNCDIDICIEIGCICINVCVISLVKVVNGQLGLR